MKMRAKSAHFVFACSSPGESGVSGARGAGGVSGASSVGADGMQMVTFGGEGGARIGPIFAEGSLAEGGVCGVGVVRGAGVVTFGREGGGLALGQGASTGNGEVGVGEMAVGPKEGLRSLSGLEFCALADPHGSALRS